MKNMIKILWLTMLTLLFLVGSASALTTYVNPVGGGNGSEPSLVSIIDGIYGAANLTRVDDNYDKIWQDCPGCAAATWEAKYASYSQYFGFSAINGTGMTPIFNSVSGTVGKTYKFAPVGQFVFYDNPNNLSSPPVWYSLMSLNDGNGDHMVTWKIAPSANNDFNNCDYVIAFEDEPLGRSDKDYNDLVIEVKNIKTAVPEPTTMLLLGLGLIGVAGIRRKFRS